MRKGKSTQNRSLPCDELRARRHYFDGQLLLSEVLVDFQRLQKVRENLIVDPPLSPPVPSQLRVFFSRVPPVVSKTNPGTRMRRDSEKKVVYEVCGDIFLDISFICNVALVEFVELRRCYAGCPKEKPKYCVPEKG